MTLALVLGGLGKRAVLIGHGFGTPCDFAWVVMDVALTSNGNSCVTERSRKILASKLEVSGSIGRYLRGCR